MEWNLWTLGIVLFVIPLSFFLRRRRNFDKEKLNVAFIHLDLGLGGAERLVVDAACALQSKGHNVKIYTTNHPKDHCFPETLDILKVEVHGHFIPHHIFHRFQIVCSLVRMCYLAFKMVFFVGDFDIVFCDGVSACIPILKLSGAKIIFYCHYPDQLLTRKTSILRSIYRYPWDLLEEVTTNMADRVVVNSKFTQGIFRQTFKRISEIPSVIYPCINIQQFDSVIRSLQPSLDIPSNKTVFLSLNRFDPNKKVELALEAFALLKEKQPQKLKDFILIIAGGYDPNVNANVNYLRYLQEIASSHQLTHEIHKKETSWSSSVIFMQDISETQKIELLKRSLALLYTPSGEHFGIVPVEGMTSECAVIGVTSGGLLETVREDRQVGFLSAPTPQGFAEAMDKLVQDPSLAKEMGQKGRARAIAEFSFERMADALQETLNELTKTNH